VGELSFVCPCSFLFREELQRLSSPPPLSSLPSPSFFSSSPCSLFPSGSNLPSSERQTLPPSSLRELPVRIAKRIARVTHYSRRQAEILIAQKRVSLNNKLLDVPHVNVTSRDKIVIDGHQIPTKTPKIRVWLHNKRNGVLVTNQENDPEGRTTLLPHLRRCGLPPLTYVGRLDYNSQGLLLLTNSGALAHVLERPDTELPRKYLVKVHGRLQQRRLKRLKNGIAVDGFFYKGMDVSVAGKKMLRESRVKEKMEAGKKEGPNHWITVTLREGKNREIKRVMEQIGLKTSRIIRIQYGPYFLDRFQVPAGTTMSVPLTPEIKELIKIHQIS